MTRDERLARLTTLTSMSLQEWADFESETPEQQEITAQGYMDMDWRKDPNIWAEVKDILLGLGSIAGAVSGVTGAVTGISTMIKALGG